MKDKLLVIDVGNTNTVFGIFNPGSKEPVFHKRTVSRRDRTSDELGVFLKGFLKEDEISPHQIGNAIYSSVVPPFNPIVERMLGEWFQVKPMKVHYQMNLPFRIKYARPFEIGADRLVDVSAAVALCKGPKIIIDMGTATTFCVVNEDEEYVGGIIAPGLKLSMDSLAKGTAQLPSIIFQTPTKVIGDSTIESMQSGFFYGWIGMLEGIIKEIEKETNVKHTIIGTGGLVTSIHNDHHGIFDVIDPLLTLKGLEIIFQLNRF